MNEPERPVCQRDKNSADKIVRNAASGSLVLHSAITIDARPFEYALSLIGGKWKLNILFWLWRAELLRYGQLKNVLSGITHKMLSNQLKELEKDQLIIRHEYPQVPPKVEYTLSERGKSLMPVLHALCIWGRDHLEE